MTKSIKLAVKEKGPESQEETEYRFNGFNDRDFTFKYIRRLWTNASPYAGENETIEPSETEDNNAPTSGSSISPTEIISLRITVKSVSIKEEKTAAINGDLEF